jgi:hypothetical protein
MVYVLGTWKVPNLGFHLPPSGMAHHPVLQAVPSTLILPLQFLLIVSFPIGHEWHEFFLKGRI